MWLKSEIDELAKLYGELEDELVTDYLSTEALSAIQNCGPFTIYNLRNWMLVPKHNKNPKTLRLTRLCKSLDLEDWLMQIQQKINPSFPITIEIGFSFLARAKEEVIFIFCPKALASYSVTANSKTEFTNFMNKVKSMKDSEHLQNTFLNQEAGTAFTASGYRPLSLISNTIWITK